VTSQDRAHRTERVEHATGAVDTGIGRRGQPTRPKGCQRLRSDGVQATKTFAKVKGARQAARAKGQGVGQGAGQLIARLTYRQRYAQSTGREPCLCPHCGHERGVGRIWHPPMG